MLITMAFNEDTRCASIQWGRTIVNQSFFFYWEENINVDEDLVEMQERKEDGYVKNV